jgi:hypothetical protein
VAVRTTVPRGRTVLVVSRGDEQFVRLEGRRGWHFPRHDDGRWAGFHPADSQEAIEHLEALRSQGAQYLVFPQTAFWWLDYYGDLNEHLEERYRLVATSESCRIYDVRTSRVAGADARTTPEADQPSPRVADIVRRLLPADATIAVLGEDGNGITIPDPERTVQYQPGPDDSAGESLGRLVATGAEFLVIPRSASGWLESRPQLERHLREHHRLVMRQKHLCEIYELTRDNERLRSPRSGRRRHLGTTGDRRQAGSQDVGS